MYEQMLHTYQLSCHITKSTRKGKKLINHICSNICKKKILHSDVLPCLTISDHDAPYIIVNILTNKYKIRYKFIRNLKHFDSKTYINYFKTLPFSTVYSYNETDDQLDTLKQINSLSNWQTRTACQNKIYKTTSTLDERHQHTLQCERDHWGHEAYKNPTDENWKPTQNPETKSKKGSKKRKLNSTEKFYLQKTAKKFGK